MSNTTDNQTNLLVASKLLAIRFLHLKNTIFGLVLLVFSVQLFTTSVQAATYTYRNDVFSYDTPSVSATSVVWHAGTDGTWLGSPACTSYPNGDDDWADVVFPSGFTFTFNGITYSQVRVYSNGMLAFGTDVSGFHRDYTPQALPINAIGSPGPTAPCTLSAIPSNLMIAYWTDIIAGSATGMTGAAVKYELLTTAGQRRFVISWDNVALYGSAATRYSFQVVLYESSGGLNSNFKYQYTKPLNGSGVTGNPGAVGVQLSTTDYTQYSYNQAFIDPVIGTTILWYPANQLASKGAEYRFDEGAWTGVAGEIKDTSGSGSNATRVGTAASIAAGKLCRGGSFTNNTSNATIDAVATPIVPANKGSVDFWYLSTNAWNSANTLLFDATTVAARPFFLMKRSTGALRFVTTDSAGTVITAETSTAYTYAAATWHHIGVSWNLQPGTNQTVQQIFLDGVLVATNTTTPFRSTTTGSIATLSTLYIGDNRTSGITPSSGTPNGANGTIDEVYMYSTDINASQAAADMALTRPACTALDHFHIVHSGSQLSCSGSVANITIEAHDPNHALIALSGATMAMSTSTSHGTWSGVTTINPVINTTSGNGSYTFSNESSIVLGLSNTFVESLNINLASGIITEHSGAAATCVANDYTFGSTCDANLDFVQTGFRFVDSAGNNIATQVAGITSGTYYLQAVKNTCITPGVCTGICTSVFPAATAVNIGLAFECKNPTTCAGQQVTLAASGTANAGLGAIAANNNGVISATTGAYTTQHITFNAASPTPAVPFTLNYPDVGQIGLWARYPATGTATVSGSSAAFIVKPHHFSVSAIKQTAAPQLVNPAAASTTDAKFVKAGEAFTATVTAMNSSNVATPNFGKETSAEGVILTRNLILPSGGATGTLSNASISGASFSNGIATVTNLAWNEVGIITLTPSIADADYLGTGDVTGTITGNIGRFIPDHFALTQGTVTPACGSFTYFGQDGFSSTAFILNAQNLANATTQNYTGSFTKLGLTSWNNFAFTSASLPAGSTLSASSTAPTGSWANGTATITAKHQASRPTALAGETGVIIKAAPTDSDAVTITATAVTPSTPLRYGRLSLQNAYGSELLDLAMPLTAQYWNGSAWLTNSDDSCTTGINLSLTDPNTADGLIPAELCAWDNGVGSGLSGLGCSVAGSGSLQFKKPPLNGNFNLNFKATGANNAGYLNVTAAIPTYLQFNWRGAGNENPTARATFGIYKGNDKIIYFRELY